MAKKDNGIFIGAGWTKTSKEGNKFISAQGGNKKLKLVAFDEETGNQFEVKYFSIFKNKSEQKKVSAPDYYMVYFPEDEQG
jgi:hypothetical protein